MPGIPRDWLMSAGPTKYDVYFRYLAYFLDPFGHFLVFDMDDYEAFVVGRLNIGLLSLVPEPEPGVAGAAGEAACPCRKVLAGAHALPELLHAGQVRYLDADGAAVQSVKDVFLRCGRNAHYCRQAHILRGADDVLRALIADGGVLAVDDYEVETGPSEHLGRNGAIQLVKRAEYRLMVFEPVLD